MRSRALFLGATLVSLLTATALPAQSGTVFDLSRGLRAQGMADLAQEYLDHLKPKLTGDNAIVLTLEQARVNLDLAEQEADEATKLGFLAAAKAEFEKFIKDAPTHPQRPQANLDLARLIAASAREAVGRARRKAGDNKAAEIERARTGFSEAAKRLDEAGKAAEALVSSADALQKSALRSITFQAKLEQGITTIYHGQSFSEEKDVRKRGELINAAKKQLQALLKEVGEDPLKWVVETWVTRCDDINQQALEDVKKSYDKVLADKSPESLAGRRLASYFRTRLIFEKDTAPKSYLDTITLTNAWLSTYPAYRNTSEGLAVRFMQGQAHENLGRGGVVFDDKAKSPTIKSISGDAIGRFKTAEVIFKSIAESDNEFSERAGLARYRCIMTRWQGEKRGDQVSANFEENYLLAEVELGKANEAEKFAKDNAAKIEDEAGREKALKQADADKKKAFRKIVYALERALRYVDSKTSAKDILDARFLLTYAYMSSGQVHQAAVLSEYIAKNFSKAPRSSAAGLYGVQAYAMLIAAAKGADGAGSGDVAAEKGRLVKLAEYVDVTWPRDPNTDVARHQWASVLRGDKRFGDAADVLAKITPNYTEVAQARVELGASAFEAQKLPNLSKDEKQKILQTALRELNALPMPVAADLADPARYATIAKLQLADLIVQAEKAAAKPNEKSYQQIEALGRDLQVVLLRVNSLQQADRLEQRAELLASAEAVRLTGIQGRAFQYSQQGNPAKVVEILDPTLNRIKARLGVKSEDKPAPAPAPVKPPAKGTTPPKKDEMPKKDDKMPKKDEMPKKDDKTPKKDDKAPAAKDEVAATTEVELPTLPDEVKAAPAMARVRFVERAIVTLALLSQVQDGKVDKANEMYIILETLVKSESGAGDNAEIAAQQAAVAAGNTLSQVVLEVGKQINDLKKAKKDKELKAAGESFAKFLDERAKSAGTMPVEVIYALAQGYGVLENHKSVADLLSKAIETRTKEVKDIKAKDDPKATSLRGMQFLRAKALRLSGQFEPAEKMFAEMFGTPEKKGWAFGSIDVMKERIFILEDQKKLTDAMAQWQKLRSIPVPPMPAELTAEEGAKLDAVKQGAALAESQKREDQKQRHLRGREQNFEFLFYQHRIFARSAVLSKKTTPAEKDAKLLKLGKDIFDFESKQPDLGGEKVQDLYLELFRDKDFAKIVEGYKEAGKAAGAKKMILLD